MLLDDLERRGLLNDERFAEQYLAMRKRRGYGPLRIRSELRERGVDAGLAAAWTETGDPGWRVLMQEVMAHKFGEGQPVDRKDLARRARFLEYRGFPPELIRAAIFGE